MRIAIYHNLTSGGGKRALYEMACRLAERHQLDVYSLTTADHDFCDLRPFARQHNVYPFAALPPARSPFGRINQGLRAADLIRLRRLERKIACDIDAAQYDVVFAHNCQYVQSPNLLRELHSPTVYFCQEPPRQIYEPQVPRDYYAYSPTQHAVNHIDPFPRLYHQTLRSADWHNTRNARLVLANSAYSRETIYRIYGISARVCYLGVDTQRFRPKSTPKQNHVISVGSLHPRKGFDFLIAALGQVPQAVRPTLIIVSNYVDVREKQFLTDLAATREVAVDFRHMISDEELVDLLCAAKLALYAPVMEPFGFAALEAMACGVPVIGVNEAGVRETVVHRETGLLVERVPSAMATAVEQLLRDDEQRVQFGRNAHAHTGKSWQWTNTLTTLEPLLQQTAQK